MGGDGRPARSVRPEDCVRARSECSRAAETCAELTDPAAAIVVYWSVHPYLMFVMYTHWNHEPNISVVCCTCLAPSHRLHKRVLTYRPRRPRNLPPESPSRLPPAQIRPVAAGRPAGGRDRGRRGGRQLLAALAARRRVPTVRAAAARVAVLVRDAWRSRGPCDDPLMLSSTFRLSATRASVLALFCTFSEVFDIPVYWPILVMYFCILFALTMRRQIQCVAALAL